MSHILNEKTGGKIHDKEKRFFMYQWIDKLEYWLLQLPKPDITIFLHMPYEYATELRKNRNSIDIVRKGCSKGTGIKIIKEHYQLEKMAGIGDSYNDLPMLKVVDTAFTFKTSPQEIQKQVHYCVNDIAEAIALLEVEK